MPFKIRFVAGVLCALLLASIADVAAQSAVNGSIRGKVTDATSATLPGVSVTLTSPALLVPAIVTQTDGQGDYAFSDLPIGNYQIGFELAGFQRLVRQDIVLTPGFTAAINATLTIGAVEETVTVAGQSPVVDTTSTVSSVSLSSKVITEVIPAVRTMTEFVGTAPGVVLNQRHDLGGPVAGPTYQAYGINGQYTVSYDGVNTRQGATQPGVAPDLGSLEEMQIVAIGGSAEQALPGVAVNMVVKSGGNNFHGRYELQGEHERLQGNNLTPALIAQGVTVGDGMIKNLELSGDLGGRIVRDKLWFYTAGRYQSATTSVLGFSKERGADGIFGTADDVPGARDSSVDNRTVKSTYQLAPKYKLIGFYAMQKMVVPSYSPSRTSPFETTQRFSNDPHMMKAELQATPSSRLLVNFSMGHNYKVAIYRAQEGLERFPTTFDNVTRMNEGPTLGQTEQPRKNLQPTGSISYFPDRSFAGKHELKVGFSHYKLTTGTGNTAGVHGSYRLTFDTIGGIPHQPFQITTYNYPVVSINRLDESGIYAQDTWRIGSRLTANLGLRWDRFHSFLPEQTKPQGQFGSAGTFAPLETGTWKQWAPRFGAALSLTADGKTVAKGTFGRYNHTPGDAYSEEWNLNSATNITYRWRDLNGNGDYDAGEVNLDTNGPDFVSISAAANNILNPDLRNAYTREATFSLEREVMANVGVKANYIYVRQTDLDATVNILRPYSAWNVPIQLRDPGADGVLGSAVDGGLIAVYDYDAAYRGSRFVGNQRVNVPAANDPRRHVLEGIVTRRTVGRWGLLGAFSAQKINRVVTPVPQSPNDEYFNRDETWDWQVKGTASYEAPFKLSLAGMVQIYNGIKGARTYQFRGIPSASTVTLRLEDFGATQGPARSMVSMRIARDTSGLGKGRLRLSFEIMNLLNSASPWSQSYASGPTFGNYNTTDGPRVARLGATYIF